MNPKLFRRSLHRQTRPSKPTVYVVEGDSNTEFEGMVFAVCTTKEKAEKAKETSLMGDELRITEIIADSIIIDNEITFL